MLFLYFYLSEIMRCVSILIGEFRCYFLFCVFFEVPALPARRKGLLLVWPTLMLAIRVPHDVSNHVLPSLVRQRASLVWAN